MRDKKILQYVIMIPNACLATIFYIRPLAHELYYK